MGFAPRRDPPYAHPSLSAPPGPRNVATGASQTIERVQVLLPAPRGAEDSPLPPPRVGSLPKWPGASAKCLTGHLRARRNFSSPPPHPTNTPLKPARSSPFPPSHPRLPLDRGDACARTNASEGG
jgi:hypothetical protein